MDPNENLKETRGCTSELIEAIDASEDLDQPEYAAEDVDRLCELVQSLDNWIMNGGFLPEDWAEKAAGGLLSRANLAVRVYDEVFADAETFEGELGLQLAYLLAAILKDKQIELDMENMDQNEVHQFFKILFEESHPVWKHVSVVNG